MKSFSVASEYQVKFTLTKYDSLSPNFSHGCAKFMTYKYQDYTFHPQSDGMVERFNKTLEAMLSTVRIEICGS